MGVSLRIGIVCYPTFGGSGVVASELGRTLAEWGQQVHFFSYASPSRLEAGNSNLRVHAVEGFSYPLFKYPPYDLALASRLIEISESAGLDIIHSHYAIPHAISAFLARESVGGKFKTVTTLHGTDITLVGADRSYYPITRLGIDVSDAVTSVSRRLREETIQTFRPRRAIEVIPNFVDTRIFAPPGSRPSREGKILVHISNFRPVKRVAEIVLAFREISREVPSRLFLAGEGPELGPVKDLVQREGLSRRVEFLGNQTAVPELLRGADLYLLASETESFGLSALEAMACGVPVIAPNVGGLPEVVTHGETGFLVPRGSPEELAQASLALLKDEGLWKRFSAAGRQRAAENFEREAVVRRYLALYERILSQG